MSSAKTARWKNLEKATAEFLKKYKIPAFRHEQRQNNYAISIDDVGIEGAEWIKIDSKYRKSGFQSHTLLNEIEDKYVKKGQVGVLVTKGYNERGQRVTIDSEFFAMLLSFYLGHGTKEELWEIYNG